MGTIQVSYDKWSEEITETRIRKAIRRTKNKKAVDRLGWAAEWVKGGEEMVKSLYIYIYCLTGSKQKIKYQSSCR